MKNTFLLCAVALLLLLCLPVAATQEMKMTTYQLVILKKGPAYATTKDTPQAQALLQEHVKFLYARAAEGAYRVAGPFTEDGPIAGIIFVEAATSEKALEIESEDPAVKAGVFTAEAMPFMSPEGWFSGKWAAFGEFEHVFFGFLDNGPNRAQDAATAKELQQQHLAYMDGQHKEGKLVVAGPFMTDGGVHRGLVVYRVSDMQEAQRRANGDPMIQAGRLVVDLHPWQVPLGALPK